VCFVGAGAMLAGAPVVGAAPGAALCASWARAPCWPGRQWWARPLGRHCVLRGRGRRAGRGASGGRGAANWPVLERAS